MHNSSFAGTLFIFSSANITKFVLASASHVIISLILLNDILQSGHCLNLAPFTKYYIILYYFQYNYKSMARHHPDLIMCRKQPGIQVGRVCEKCDGKCVICDSYVRPCVLVKVCDECNYGSYQGRCVVCGGQGVSDAYYCRECVQQEKDRDGCPKIVNLGSAKTDLFYERKKYGFKKR